MHPTAKATAPRSFASSVAVWALAYSLLFAASLFWMLGLALGLGFKEPSQWTLFDHVTSNFAPVLYGALRLPGSLLPMSADPNPIGLFVVWIINVAVWAFGLAYCSILFRRWRDGIQFRKEQHSKCGICGRRLDDPTDLLSVNCGGDCWGCIGEIEADLGNGESLERVRDEFRRGLRPQWKDPNGMAM